MRLMCAFSVVNRAFAFSVKYRSWVRPTLGGAVHFSRVVFGMGWKLAVFGLPALTLLVILGNVHLLIDNSIDD